MLTCDLTFQNLDRETLRLIVDALPYKHEQCVDRHEISGSDERSSHAST
jgi:hypothetical protein